MKTQLTIRLSNKKVIGDFNKGEKFCLQWVQDQVGKEQYVSVVTENFSE